MARKNDNAGQARRASSAAKKARAQDVPAKVVEDRKDTTSQPPADQKALAARRRQDDDKNRQAVAARESQLAAQADPSRKHASVVVSMKATERAALAEQERIDIGKRAAERQQRQTPPPPPPTEGTVPEEANPAHPFQPGPRGSSTHSPSIPAGPMDADVVYVTDDIKADGTPNVSQGFVEGKPEWDGESDRDYSQINAGGRKWQHAPAEQVGATNDAGELEPVINSHSEEGARLDEIKLGRPVKYVPNDNTLDPQSGNPRRADGGS